MSSTTSRDLDKIAFGVESSTATSDAATGNGELCV